MQLKLLFSLNSLKATSTTSLEDPDAYDDDDDDEENANKNDEGEGEEEENAEEDAEVPVEDKQPLPTTQAVPPQQSAESPAVVQSSTQASAKSGPYRGDCEGGCWRWAWDLVS